MKGHDAKSAVYLTLSVSAESSGRELAKSEWPTNDNCDTDLVLREGQMMEAPWQ